MGVISFLSMLIYVDVCDPMFLEAVLELTDLLCDVSRFMS